MCSTVILIFWPKITPALWPREESTMSCLVLSVLRYDLCFDNYIMKQSTFLFIFLSMTRKNKYIFIIIFICLGQNSATRIPLLSQLLGSSKCWKRSFKWDVSVKWWEVINKTFYSYLEILIQVKLSNIPACSIEMVVNLRQMET